MVFWLRENMIATGVIIAVTLLNIIVYKLRQLKEANLSERHSKRSSLANLCRSFSIVEIELATNNFDNGMVIGKGGFGVVYKGLIDDEGKTRAVAVKRFNSKSNQGPDEFWTEIELLSKFRHSHLVSLIGYCNAFHEMILVYEYMSNGTLADHLYKNGRHGTIAAQSLSWERRLKICIGAARGLDYLHTGTGVQNRVIHRDVKSTNILLDENWAAKISDFGLSKIGPANQSCTHVSTNVKGTFGYLDPEYFLTHRLTRKSDVYAFGVVLFEVLCGRPSLDFRLHEDQHALALYAKRSIKEGTLHQIIDPNLSGQISSNCLEVFVEIAEKCLHNQRNNRPTMVEIVAKLELALASQESTGSLVQEEFLVDTTADGGIDNQEDSDSSTEHEEVSIISEGRSRHHNTPINEIMQIGKAHGSTGQIGTSLFTPIKRRILKEFAIATKGTNRWRKKTNNGTSNSSGPSLWSDEIQRHHFTVADIQAATKNFDAGLILAASRYSTVFKGYINGGHTAVAIKQIELRTRDTVFGSFCHNVVHPTINHLHVLPLIGWCHDDNKLCLVSKYMSNGSLHDHLYGKFKTGPLSWSRRLRICIGVAQGMNYLHTGIAEQTIVHGKLKPTKILLDENWIPKVSGFELCKMETSARKYEILDSTKIPSNFFLELWMEMDPEYLLRGRLTAKSDVYSIGVLLLEVLFVRRSIITQSLATERTQVQYPSWLKSNIAKRSLHQFVDPHLMGKIAPECFVEFVDIALNCLLDQSEKRPSMSGVVERLEYALQLQGNAEVASHHFDRTEGTHGDYAFELKNVYPELSGCVARIMLRTVDQEENFYDSIGSSSVASFDFDSTSLGR